MTLPRLYAMSDYWKDHPPLHLLVAAFFEVKPKGFAQSLDGGDLFGDLAAAGLRPENG